MLESIKSMLPSFGGIVLADVFDILIVAGLILFIIAKFRESRAGSIIKGIVILLLVYLISQFAHLYTLGWVLEQVLNIGLISLVVIFQPEIRRTLDSIGRRSKLSRNQSLSNEKIMEYAEQTRAAIGYFAQRKEGALLIFERETALTDIARTGTMIDAQISQELIENIFYKGSPLHDGAAIIRGDRILAAGCVLPLTENTNLSKELGTRHRAGIGMSENSDAYVLIVSEETGIISSAEDGKLSRFLDLKNVEKKLLEYYGRNQNNGFAAGLMSALRRVSKNEVEG